MPKKKQRTEFTGARSTIPFNWSKFAGDLKRCRASMNVAVRPLAEALGIDHATYLRAENGYPCTVPVFLILCELLDKDPRSYAARHIGKVRLPERQRAEKKARPRKAAP